MSLPSLQKAFTFLLCNPISSLMANEAIQHGIQKSIDVVGIYQTVTAVGKCISYSLFEVERHGLPGVVKCGGHRYQDGTRYIGDWNHKGQKHGMGHLLLPDGTRYDGAFINGLCSGLGVMQFSDGAKYEGEFMQGWFHGHGIFWRADGMKFEGEFRGGRIWGLGLVTFNDHTHGFPRNEGFFQDCRMVRKKKCPEIVQRSQKIALMARAQCDQS